MDTRTREYLYSLVPQPRQGEPPHNTEVNPLNTESGPYVEEAIHAWQEDLGEGRESKKWREEASQAGRDRAAGKFDEVKKVHRQEHWSSKPDAAPASKHDGENVTLKPGAESNGNGETESVKMEKEEAAVEPDDKSERSLVWE